MIGIIQNFLISRNDKFWIERKPLRRGMQRARALWGGLGTEAKGYYGLFHRRAFKGSSRSMCGARWLGFLKGENTRRAAAGLLG